MESLLSFQENLLRSTTNSFRRFLHDHIDWSQRMIAVKGPRGAGKTTLLLQHLKYDSEQCEDALYVTADHPWFYEQSLFSTAEQWSHQGGKKLYIDEVHKYPFWSRELKNIYDGFPDLQIVFTASSVLDIYRGEADLSRRVVSYILPGLSFREYLSLVEGVHIEPLNLAEVINNHNSWSRKIGAVIKPLPAFKKYLRHGYLPIIMEGPEVYLSKLYQIINTTLENDLIYLAGYNTSSAYKIKKLLGVIAESVPFKPNVSDLARKMELSRDSIYEFIHQLNSAQLLNLLHQAGKGVSTLQKPDKVFLENTNLSYALKNNPDLGQLRETFLLNQLTNASYQVSLPAQGDFLVNDLVIEVGGKSKNSQQVGSYDHYVLAVDDIEIGYAQKIPLWLFGFLY